MWYFFHIYFAGYCGFKLEWLTLIRISLCEKVRPNQYHVMRDLVGSLDFEVSLFFCILGLILYSD
jgi:hypothetical protein